METYKRKQETFKKIVSKIKSLGYDVYVISNSEFTKPEDMTYGYVVKGNKFGYFQTEDTLREGVTFSTCQHKPIVCSGFKLQSWDNSISVEDLEVSHIEESFISYPSWARPSERKMRRVFSSFEEYMEYEKNMFSFEFVKL